MVSKNQLLGHGDAGDSEEAPKESNESLMLYREDFKEGREFPSDMIKMMKYKGWREKSFDEKPAEEESTEEKTTQTKGSFFDLSGEKD